MRVSHNLPVTLFLSDQSLRNIMWYRLHFWQPPESNLGTGVKIKVIIETDRKLHKNYNKRSCNNTDFVESVCSLKRHYNTLTT